MKKIIICFSLSLLFIGCSFKTPPNQWHYNSANAFEAYKKDFLSSNDSLAKNDYSRAVKHAKVSSDLRTLARIYLGECSLNISVGQEDECKKFKDIQDVVNDPFLNAYYSFITFQLKKEQIPLLPQVYQDFVWHVENLEYKEANEDILKMDEVTSQLLAASLLKENIHNELRDKMIELASFHGYKKAVIFWLGEVKNNTLDNKKREEISKKISILNTKG
ncbi:MAG: hypothetical protein AUK54_04715 [Helicobacteraceae bacterium CG2_30_36_10]|nr:MAG: hypothetical protein AUK54_04715 [Helicobacteraceae bacterium CG2_30_36_10]